MKFVINFNHGRFSKNIILKMVERQFDKYKEVEVNVPFASPIQLKGIDLSPSTIQILLTSGGVIVGAVIAGLLQIAKTIASRKIVIETSSGAKLEVPVGTSEDEIDKIITKIREIEGKPNDDGSIDISFD